MKKVYEFKSINRNRSVNRRPVLNVEKISDRIYQYLKNNT